MIDKAVTIFGKFLDVLGCDWKNDSNYQDTPNRLAKA